MYDFEFDSDYVAAAYADDLLREVANNEFVEYTGSQSDWGWGTFTVAEVTRGMVAKHVSDNGNAWLSITGNFEPGWYIINITDNGTVWGHHYPDEQTALADYQRIEDEFNRTTGDEE